MTGRGNGNPLGIAYVGTVCKSTRSSRVSINRYGIKGSQKNKVLYTAEVKQVIVCVISTHQRGSIFYRYILIIVVFHQTIAHEMGHNLGMRHDFGRKDSRGKNCYGYMDYKDSTNYWSRCSVEDFTKVRKSCLAICTQKTCDGVRRCENVKSYAKYCKQFIWACTDSRYPWFRENCKKTCKAC